MATKVEAWADNAGKRHDTQRDALIADIEIALGKIGDGSTESGRIARLIADNCHDLLTPLQELARATPVKAVARATPIAAEPLAA